MFKVLIKNSLGILTHGAEFKTQLEVETWLQEGAAAGWWGKSAYTEIIPGKEAVLDENGVEIEPAVPEQVIEHPAEYTVEVIDITAQKLAEKEQLKYEARISFFTKMMAKLASQQALALKDGSLTVEQALANKQALAPVKDFGLEGSLGFALAALQQAAIVVIDKAPYIAEIEAHLAGE